MEKGGLGRGLGSLIPQLRKEDYKALLDIPIDEIRPNPKQPRKMFDPVSMAELVESIQEVGIIQPLIVRKAAQGYEIIAGERRWMAAIKAGLKDVPSILKEEDDEKSFQLALIENIQRVDLNPIEEANAYQQLMSDYSLSQVQLAKRIGKSRSDVANTIRLLKLPPDPKKMLVDGLLSEGHARVLLSLEDEKKMNSFAKKIIKRGLSVRQAEKAAKPLVHREEKKVSRETIVIDKKKYQRIVQNLSPFVVRISANGKEIVLKFILKNDRELEKLTRLIVKGMKG